MIRKNADSTINSASPRFSTAQAQADLPRPDVLRDFQQQGVPACAQRGRGFVRAGDRGAGGVVGVNLLAVEPDLDGVVAAPEH